MGIRFYCKHCEKRLNVKVKQAGEFCICPQCELEIQIPLESTVRLRKKNKKSRRKRTSALEGTLVPSAEAKSIELDVNSTNRIPVSPVSDVVASSIAATVAPPVESLLPTAPEPKPAADAVVTEVAHDDSPPVTATTNSAPVEAAPVESAPVEAAPTESAPVESASPELAPIESKTVEPAPVEPAPVEPDPVDSATVESAPTEPASHDSPSPDSRLGDKEVDVEAEIGELLASDDPDVADDTASEADSFLLSKPVAKVGDDPLKANPDLVWYLRHKRLGEKGPLKARQVEEMLEAKQLREGYIVWREDWNDWVPVEQVFPQLATGTNDTPAYEIPAELNPHSEVNRKRRARKQFLMCSFAAAFLLVVVLVYWIAQYVW